MKRMMLLAAALSLAACSSSDPVDRCATSSNPAECTAWTDAGGDVEDYLIGGMAGYMLGSYMSGGKKVTYVMANPNYHGPKRTLRSQIVSRDRQLANANRRIAQQEAKIQRQKAELRNQQVANARKSQQLQQQQRSSSSSYRPASSSRTSTRSGRR